MLRRQVSKRPQLSNSDRFLFVWLYRWFPSVLGAIAILRPETIIRWHRAGLRSYWCGTNPEANNEADRQAYQAYDFHCSYRSKLLDRSKEKGPGDGDGVALTTAQEGGTPSKGITRLLTETPARSFPKNEI